jgi:hypothetical protein
MQIDVHQHVWTQPLLEALAARDCLPFVRVTPEGLAVLHSAGERPYVIDVESETGDERSRQLRVDGTDLALVAISSPIGIEALAQENAHELISAHLDGVLALGDGFAAWGPLAIEAPDPAQVDDLLGRGCVGISVSAGAIADRDLFDALAPALERVQARGVALFVHPGPGLDAAPAEASLTEPLWWQALTDYVSQMQAAWLTFATYGRRELPTLRALFSMLAGGAPLLSERLAARGGPEVDLRDPLTFYDTSSYGPKIVEAMARWVGPGQLMYGSDRPVIEPVRTGREVELMANGATLLIPAGAVI